MFYELLIATRTVRREGIRSLFCKLGCYFSQLFRAGWRLMRRPPTPQTPELAVQESFESSRGLFSPGQIREEILALARQVQALSPRVVVEIGTFTGGTFFIWCAMAEPTATLISLDLPGGIHGGGYPAWKKYLYRSFGQPEQKVHFMRADSHQPASLNELRQLLNGKMIDFLFIDGDHTYEGVKKDFNMYAPLVRPGGIIAMHDIAKHPPELNCDVDRFWNEIRTSKNTEEFINDPAQGSCGIGMIRVPPNHTEG